VARLEAAYGHGMSCAPTKNSTARARRWAKLMERIEAMTNQQQEAALVPEPATAQP